LRVDGVEVHGAVEDLELWYNRCRVFVAPTRFSAGIPIKVLDAAAHGVPSVITDELARQLKWTPDQDMCMAGDASGSRSEAFIQQIERLYTDEAVWNRVRQGGLERIRKEHSFEAMRRGIQLALDPRSRP
jgi:glycosyltransferase involved in cell wall biosynthesis